MEQLADRILFEELQVSEAVADEGATCAENAPLCLSSNSKASSSHNMFSALKQAIEKLQAKLREPIKKKFYLHKCYNSHILPLTNVCFDRSGERCLTGSYDRTCHVINTSTGLVQHVLNGHDNVVFSVAFNTPRWYV